MSINRGVLSENRSKLDRALSLFTEIRPGEGVTAMLLAANVFFLLAAYSVLKVVRESLILAEDGAVVEKLRRSGTSGAVAGRGAPVWQGTRPESIAFVWSAG